MIGFCPRRVRILLDEPFHPVPFQPHTCPPIDLDTKFCLLDDLEIPLPIADAIWPEMKQVMSSLFTWVFDFSYFIQFDMMVNMLGASSLVNLRLNFCSQCHHLFVAVRFADSITFDCSNPFTKRNRSDVSK